MDTVDIFIDKKWGKAKEGRKTLSATNIKLQKSFSLSRPNTKSKFKGLSVIFLYYGKSEVTHFENDFVVFQYLNYKRNVFIKSRIPSKIKIIIEKEFHLCTFLNEEFL